MVEPTFRVRPLVSALLSALVLTAALGGCAVTRVAPPAEPPAPIAFAEDSAWQRTPVAAPVGTEGWRVFHEPQLDAWLRQLTESNISLQVQALQVRAAQATLDASSQAFWPTVGVAASASRSATVNGGSGAGTAGHDTGHTLGKTVQLGATASWELDLWGRLGLAHEAASAQSQASQLDLLAAQLSTQATFVQTYLAWRYALAQASVLTRTLDAQTKALAITQARYDGGMVTRADVLQADTLLQLTRAQLSEARVQAGQLRHSLAALLGTTADSLPWPAEVAQATSPPPPQPDALLPQPPALPPLLPSKVLAARPDVQAARARVTAAYAQIGVADAAWLPSLDLAASAGYKGSSAASLISAPHLYWSLGPSLAATLLDGGQRKLASAQARINGDASSLAYRQVVLNAIQEVESNLVLARELTTEEVALNQARQSAQQNLALVLAQYAAGTVSYLTVTSAQTSLLNSELSWLGVRQRQLLAASVLIKNLGGVDLAVASPGQSKP